MTFPTLALFDSFPRERILFEDDDLVVIDKPFGLATHAAEEQRHDDVVSWLKRHYQRLGVSDYLGIHQRLDRDTSGVLLFTRRKQANAAIARQFEGRTAEKSYLAVVEGKPPARAELVHYLREGEDGVRVARAPSGPPKRGEQQAVTLLETRARKGGRALVSLAPKTGRTHQLRAQLRALSAPIVGDALYGGAPATRLMLHAAELSITHPSTQAPLTLSAAPPRELSLALEGQDLITARDPESLAAALRHAAERRFGVVADGRTNTFRLVHAEGDALPGVTVDLYGEHAVLSLYETTTPEEVARLGAALIAIGVKGVYVKHRPKHASRIVDSRRDEVAPKEPIAGQAAPEAFTVKELDLELEVRLGDGLSTGVFLDQRENRRRVRELARGARMLNLFAYTGSFSLAAALGGASSTTTVDASRSVLDWAQQNLARAGFSGSEHELSESDVFTFLSRAKAKSRRWDLIVLDPPSFSTTKSATFSAESDLDKLLALTLGVAADGARVLVCTNHRGIVMAKLRRHVHEAARAAKVELGQVKSLPPPSDYPPVPGREPHLKSLLVTVKTAAK